MRNTALPLPRHPPPPPFSSFSLYTMFPFHPSRSPLSPSLSERLWDCSPRFTTFLFYLLPNFHPSTSQFSCYLSVVSVCALYPTPSQPRPQNSTFLLCCYLLVIPPLIYPPPPPKKSVPPLSCFGPKVSTRFGEPKDQRAGGGRGREEQGREGGGGSRSIYKDWCVLRPDTVRTLRRDPMRGAP